MGALPGILGWIKTVLVGANRIDVYGGTKGGYDYLIFYDQLKGEVISQFVSPPKKESKNVGGGVMLPGVGGIGGTINYQSEKTFGDAFAIMNTGSTIQATAQDLQSAAKQAGLNPPEIAPGRAYKLEKNQDYVAGTYKIRAGFNDLAGPIFESHFGKLDQDLEAALT